MSREEVRRDAEIRLRGVVESVPDGFRDAASGHLPRSRRGGCGAETRIRVIDLTLRCPTCGQRADMCFAHGDDWKKGGEVPSMGEALSVLLNAEADRVEPREGILTVYDHNGRCVGCIGSETWQNLVAAEAGNSHVVSTASDFLDGGWHGECSCGWSGSDHVAHDEALEDAQIHARAANSQARAAHEQAKR